MQRRATGDITITTGRILTRASKAAIAKGAFRTLDFRLLR
jgi:hypothetical protein